MSPQPPQKVRKPQEALHAKPKGSLTCRLCAPCDKAYREDMLAFAANLMYQSITEMREIRR